MLLDLNVISLSKASTHCVIHNGIRIIIINEMLLHFTYHNDYTIKNLS